MKKFANVFELLAEAARLGREVERKYTDGAWGILHRSYSIGACHSLFDAGDLRLKPQFKTVEGYVVVTPGTPPTSAHLGAYVQNPFVYAEKGCSPARRTGGDIIAKITFEVEE